MLALSAGGRRSIFVFGGHTGADGHKTDAKDAEWTAQLVRHGLVAKSFVPPPAIRDLRELVRHRRTLVEMRTAMRNRVLKLLERANIKLSGMAMLEALAAGTNNASEIAGLARGPVFASARRLAAWAGVAPGNDGSAVKSAPFAAASAAVRTKGSYYRDQYNRLRARRGPVRAIVATAHKLLIAAFHMLGTGGAFRGLGESYLDQAARKRPPAKLVQRLSNLGCDRVRAVDHSAPQSPTPHSTQAAADAVGGNWATVLRNHSQWLDHL